MSSKPKDLRPSVLFCAATLGLTIPIPALADSISAYFNQPQETVYSKEKPDKTYYGNGESGRMSEASTLRFLGEQDLADRNYAEAFRKLGKAVQLDPGNPTGHVLYARAATARLFENKGPVDEKLLKHCTDEWKLIFYHDADYIEQCEARLNLKRLNKITKALNREKKDKEKALLAEKAKKPDQSSTAKNQ